MVALGLALACPAEKVEPPDPAPASARAHPWVLTSNQAFTVVALAPSPDAAPPAPRTSVTTGQPKATPQPKPAKAQAKPAAPQPNLATPQPKPAAPQPKPAAMVTPPPAPAQGGSPGRESMPEPEVAAAAPGTDPSRARAVDAGRAPEPEPVAVAKKNATPAPSNPAPTALAIEAELLAPDAGVPGPDWAATPRRRRARAALARAEAPPPTASIPGAPLPIPGAKITFEATRVERFLAEGGHTLAGRVLDADSQRAVDQAQIEAWMGTRSIHAETDAGGRFRMEGMVPGSRVTLWITAPAKYVQERVEIEIRADRDRLDAIFKLLPRSAARGHSGGIGVFLSRRAAGTVISGLDAFGPAERAGLAIGDVLTAVGKRDVAELGPGAIEYLLRGTIGEQIEITVVRAGAPRKLLLKRSGR